MEGLELFLSDKFGDFSKNMLAIHEQIKKLDEQFKEQLRTYKKAKAELETGAKELLESWKTQSEKKVEGKE